MNEIKRGAQVEISKPMVNWPHAASAEPKVGFLGLISEDDDRWYRCPEDHVPVDFHSHVLGYGWQRDSDEDWEYIRYFIPITSLKFW